jgi:hypothetical protein
MLALCALGTVAHQRHAYPPTPSPPVITAICDPVSLKCIPSNASGAVRDCDSQVDFYGLCTSCCHAVWSG